MAAPLGNKNNLKYKTPEQRKDLLEKVIAHLEAGYHQDTFPECDWDTVQSYCKNYPVEFPSEKIEAAKRKGLNLLEKLGHAGMTGSIDKFNPTTWIFIMKNKAHWKDRTDITSEDHAVQGPIVYVPAKNTE